MLLLARTPKAENGKKNPVISAPLTSGTVTESFTVKHFEG
jgi:hypothetical protein